MATRCIYFLVIFFPTGTVAPFASKTRKPTRRLPFWPTYRLAGFDDRCVVQEPLAGRIVLQADQAASAHPAFPRLQRERGADANPVRPHNLRSDC